MGDLVDIPKAEPVSDERETYVYRCSMQGRVLFPMEKGEASVVACEVETIEPDGEGKCLVYCGQEYPIPVLLSAEGANTRLLWVLELLEVEDGEG